MQFKYWLLFNENIDLNFNIWMETIVKYAKPNEIQSLIIVISEENRGLYSMSKIGDKLDSLVNKKQEYTAEEKDFIHNEIILERSKNVIKTVLKEKNVENYNWFAFSVGYLAAKPDYQTEDLDLAIEATKRRIDSGELPKTEIGVKGWLVVGKEAQKSIDDYLNQRVSKRELGRMKKKGLSLQEDPELVKLLTDKNNVKLYFLPKLNDKIKITQRHLLLCKYGKGTHWCTAQPSWDAHLAYKSKDIYIIHFNDKPMYQFVGCMDDGYKQFMDTNDRSVSELEGDILDVLQETLPGNVINCYGLTKTLSSQEVMDILTNVSAFKKFAENCEGNEKMMHLFKKTYSRDNYYGSLTMKNVLKYSKSYKELFKYPPSIEVLREISKLNNCIKPIILLLIAKKCSDEIVLNNLINTGLVLNYTLAHNKNLTSSMIKNILNDYEIKAILDDTENFAIHLLNIGKTPRRTAELPGGDRVADAPAIDKLLVTKLLTHKNIDKTVFDNFIEKIKNNIEKHKTAIISVELMGLLLNITKSQKLNNEDLVKILNIGEKAKEKTKENYIRAQFDYDYFNMLNNAANNKNASEKFLFDVFEKITSSPWVTKATSEKQNYFKTIFNLIKKLNADSIFEKFMSPATNNKIQNFLKETSSNIKKKMFRYWISQLSKSNVLELLEFLKEDVISANPLSSPEIIKAFMKRLGTQTFIATIKERLNTDLADTILQAAGVSVERVFKIVDSILTNKPDIKLSSSFIDEVIITASSDSKNSAEEMIELLGYSRVCKLSKDHSLRVFLNGIGIKLDC